MSKITLLRNLFSILFITFFALQLTAQTTYNTNGTYTVPAGVTAVSVEAWGGGGHGSNRSSNGLGGGGGGGAFSKKLVTVVPGSTYTVRVGNGSSDTNPGGDSWFINATTVLAKGGNSPADNSPTGAAGGSATASIGDIRFAGGNGANGNSDGGGGGSSAGPLANGNAATNYLGATAPAGGGNGGNGATGNNSNGVAGLSPGGGGGGAQRSNNGNRQGGNGANGQVIITPAGGMEIDVRGNNISIVNGDVTPATGDNTDYGTTNVAGGNLTEGYTIHNTGTYALTLGTVTITGTHAADFTIVTVPATTVSPNSSTTLAIKFDPSAVGIRTATVTIPNNDNNESPYTFAIQGDANNADPNIFVIGNSIDIPDGNTTVSTADNTHFGPIDVALGTVSRTFTIQNRAPSAVALSIGAITITGANPGDFTVTTAPASTLFVNGTTTFTIQFNPSAAGVRTATINIANNNTTRNPYNFNVEGLGTGPEIAITGNNVIIVDGDTTPVMTDDTDFGFVSSTGGTIVKTFTIYNLSSANEVLTLGAITITGANAADFTITAMPALSIAVGASTTITISFDPSAIGQRNAVLSISNNDGDETPYNFAIRGTGSNAEIAVQGNAITINDGDITPSELDKTDFGTVSIDNGSVLITYTIRNTGTTPMSVGAITFSGPDTDCFSVATPPASTVAINGTTTFVVNFAPAATVGQKNVVISIVNDDANENPYDFALTGLAVRTYPDTDGDTISDNIDIDDDNDGILDIDEQSQCVDSPLATTAGHLFLNETFGAGTSRGRININIPGATSTYCYEDGIVGVNTPPLCVDQGDWSVNDGEYTVNHTISGPSGDPANISTWSSTNWTRQIDHTPGDVAGRMAIFNASYTPQVFYETVVSGIMPNVPLTYSFWALNIMSQSHYGGTILPNITVEFIDLENDAVVSTFNTGNIGRCGTTTGDNSCALSQWKNFTTTVNLGNVTSFIIRFINNATGGNGNDLALDDITIEQDYCDYEMDLISNLFDLDSDNDGIPDIEEAGFAHLSVGQGIMDLDETVWRDENRNGLHDEIDQLRSDGAYIIIDSDFDGVADYLDLDSDNDSLFDVDESGLFNGDGDVDGDGVGDGLDTDEDGFLDVFDAFTGRGTLVRPFAQITTGSGNPDYRNVDSDYDGIYDITPTLHNNFDIYGIGEIIGTDDIDRDGIYDNFDTTVAFMGSPRDLDRKLLLRFDGRNDYAAAPGMLGNLAQSSIMGWIKLSSTFDTTGYVVGQENFNIKIEASGNKVVATAKGISVTYPVDLAVDRWYHVAAVYDGGNPTEKLQLYVNGQMEVASNAGSLAGTLPASASPLTIGKYAAGNADYFKGDIDEVRVFNTALTTDQLQKMVYQEVGQNAAAVRGAIIPRDIEGSSWASMLACFRMDVYKDDVIDNLATTAID
ncbi:MAG TPA: choice-of-anchor D domain-containing protein, partial [Flavobacterium sp.]|nr:choice-of-anchor D domain-containing protein [Flavobacterium sp.]